MKDVKEKGVGGGSDPPEPPSPSSSSSSSSSSSPSSSTSAPKKKQPVQSESNSPLLKLDVKFELPTYNGEVDAEKLDNWIKQVEVYCRIQKFTDDASKIQLATLCLGGTALIWWESRTQEDLSRYGKIISSWFEFTTTLKKQFYQLGHMQKAVMNWQSLRQEKGQSVQEYTQEFRKRALIFGVPLYTQETLLKYIGGLHENLRHTILMFNPTNFDEVSVQAIHLETGSRNSHDNLFMESNLHKGSKKGKEKNATNSFCEERGGEALLLTLQKGTA